MEIIMTAENFSFTTEHLTPEPFLGLREAMKVRGCKSQVTIWSNIRKGTFPEPDAILNNVRLWRQSTLKQWQDELTGHAA
jgi:predicted DNA-binding transcriptional regulator AlpA